MGYIYKITNTINNKCYIGQSRMENIDSRWNIHKNPKKKGCPLLKNSINKYGLENFKFEVIIICFDQDLNKFEIEYIKKYNSQTPNGYNILPGGEYYITNEKPVYQYSLDGKFIKEFKSRVDAAKETKLGENFIRNCANFELTSKKFLWRNYKTDTIEICNIDNSKCSQQIIWSHNIQSKIKFYILNENPVYQYSIDGKFIKEFKNIIEASRETKTNIECIIACANERQKSTLKFIWRNFKVDCLFDNYKYIYQYDFNSNLIDTHLKICEASKKTGIDRNVIFLCLSKQTNCGGDFFWSYEKLEKVTSIPRKGSGKPKIVNMYDDLQVLIKQFNSVLDIQKEKGIPKSSMCQKLKVNQGQLFEYKGYFWKEEI